MRKESEWMSGYGWPADDQMQVHKITDANVDIYEEVARTHAWDVELGSFNWPAVVRNLCAEVRRLKEKTKE